MINVILQTNQEHEFIFMIACLSYDHALCGPLANLDHRYERGIIERKMMTQKLTQSCVPAWWLFVLMGYANKYCSSFTLVPIIATYARNIWTPMILGQYRDRYLVLPQLPDESRLGRQTMNDDDSAHWLPIRNCLVLPKMNGQLRRKHKSLIFHYHYALSLTGNKLRRG